MTKIEPGVPALVSAHRHQRGLQAAMFAIAHFLSRSPSTSFDLQFRPQIALGSTARHITASALQSPTTPPACSNADRAIAEEVADQTVWSQSTAPAHR
ncbi:hypothetical protein ACWEGE_38395 [Amycolatopsis sp. NPDC004747]